MYLHVYCKALSTWLEMGDRYYFHRYRCRYCIFQSNRYRYSKKYRYLPIPILNKNTEITDTDTVFFNPTDTNTDTDTPKNTDIYQYPYRYRSPISTLGIEFHCEVVWVISFKRYFYFLYGIFFFIFRGDVTTDYTKNLSASPPVIYFKNWRFFVIKCETELTIAAIQ